MEETKKNTIKDFFKKLSKKKTYDYTHEILHSRRDWSRILVMFIVLILVGASFNFYLFLRITAGDIFDAQAGLVDAKTLDRKVIRDIIDSFDKRALELEEIKKAPPSIPDPLL